MIKKIALSTITAILLACTFEGVAFAYSNSNMISDEVFDDYTSMNEEQVRSFINQHPNTCLPKSGSIFLEPKDYFVYGPGKVDAARVVYKAAQYWKLNPQVILTTLQKEQSLITDNDCKDPEGFSSLKKAMGYGCFEGDPLPPCPLPEYSGFEKQVMKASWQLKFNKERANGNIDWNRSEGDNNLYYYGPFTKGERRTSANTPLVYYDGYWTISGKNTWMGTGATASLYSFTPHLNQSFPSIFISFFGYDPSIGLVFKGERITGPGSSSSTIENTTTKTVSVRFKNTGDKAWYDSVSAPAANARPVILRATDPNGNPSSFNGEFATDTRATETFSTVYHNGEPKQNNKNIVYPGQVAEFSFRIKIPDGLAPGNYYRIAYQPVMPAMNGEPRTDITGVETFYINIVETYGAERWRGPGASSTSLIGESKKEVQIQFKNTGKQPWYDKVSAAANNKRPVVLMATHPNGGPSGFNGEFATTTRATEEFSGVLSINGQVKSTDTHIVKPGETAIMKFTIAAPNLEPGPYYRIAYQLVMPNMLGMPRTDINESDIYYLEIEQPHYSAERWRGPGSSSTEMSSNSSKTVTIQFKNTGNTSWYDKVSAPTYNKRPVVLMATHPNGGPSGFNGEFATQTRATEEFASVLDVNGQTKTDNNHVVKPGETAVVKFTIKAPELRSGPYYRINYQLVMPNMMGVSRTDVSNLDTYYVTIL